jgi:hypothetical protein
MKKLNVTVIMPILLLAVLSFAIPSKASTVTANSCSESDVQAAITSASRGATVTVPAGSCTWGSTLTITKGLTLAGAGTGSTVVINGTGDGTVLQISPDSTAIANSETIKVSGFTFDGAGTGYALISVTGASDSGTKPFKNLIVTGNTFQNVGSTSGTGNNAIVVGGEVRGVISGNTFDKLDFPFRSFGNDTTTEWSNTAYNNFSYGSPDNLYFESNTIHYSSSYTSSEVAAGWIESGQGGRLVVRFNTWDMTNAGGQSEFWDIHGFQNFYGSSNGQTGTMIAEYYNNTILHAASTVYRWIDHRGSWGMFVNNTYSGGSSPDIEVNQYDGGCTNQIVPAPTNYNPLVNNTYFINNTVNGSVSNAIAGSVNSCGVAENTNFYNQNASFNGTVGVGYGVLASRPSTCTTGVGYWATDQGSWNTSGRGGQGVLYKCTSTNTWTPYYTPYTYPHPLLTGGSTSVAAPTNLNAVVQ